MQRAILFFNITSFPESQISHFNKKSEFWVNLKTEGRQIWTIKSLALGTDYARKGL
tara:strand:+ start:1565 stop:1732 length:168 start_codon:yes stop_codon:yes gene_type:complete